MTDIAIPGRARGGYARAAAMSPEERRACARKAAQARWNAHALAPPPEPRKTLEQAIGCWTVTPEYNSLPELAKMVRESAVACRNLTKRNRPELLLRELEVLIGRIDTIQSLAVDAKRRLREIIETGELGQ